MPRQTECVKRLLSAQAASGPLATAGAGAGAAGRVASRCARAGAAVAAASWSWCVAAPAALDADGAGEAGGAEGSAAGSVLAGGCEEAGDGGAPRNSSTGPVGAGGGALPRCHQNRAAPRTPTRNSSCQMGRRRGTPAGAGPAWAGPCAAGVRRSGWRSSGATVACASPAIARPQRRQKRATARLGAPQPVHASCGAAGVGAAASARAPAPSAAAAGSRGVAHCLQNLAMGRFPVPHAGQVLDKRNSGDGVAPAGSRSGRPLRPATRA